MEVNLLHCTPLHLIANAIRFSHANHHLSDSFSICNDSSKLTCPKCNANLKDESSSYFSKFQCKNCISEYTEYDHIGYKDFDLIRRVGFKYKHESVLEHGVFLFEIKGVSRALLQELARHRIASLTVKSTRYTLKELRNEKEFYDADTLDIKILENELQPDDFYESENVKRASKYIVLTGNLQVDIASVFELELLRRIVKLRFSNDISKYTIPEAFKTEFQWTINLRSLINFLALRSSSDALWEIRNLALTILDVIKDKQPLYFELLMENDTIRKNYELAHTDCI